MNLFLFALAVIGLTEIVRASHLFEPVREYLKARLPAKAYEVFECRQCFGFGSDALDERGADEDGMERVVEALDGEVRFEAVDLPAEGVALDAQVHEPDAAVRLTTLDVAGKQDHARTRAPHGQAALGGVLDGLFEGVEDQELADGRALPAGDDQAVQILQVLWGPNFADDDRRVGAAQHGRVLGEIPLDR